MTEGAKRKRILAVASGGGHWEQLMLMRDAWNDQDVYYACTIRGIGGDTGLANVHHLSDCNRSSRLDAIKCALSALLLLIRLRPDHVVTTGALPGLITLILAKWLGTRTIWIDSVANAEEMSLAGQRARKYADLWLSQWPHVAKASGATFSGSVL